MKILPTWTCFPSTTILIRLASGVLFIVYSNSQTIAPTNGHFLAPHCDLSGTRHRRAAAKMYHKHSGAQTPQHTHTHIDATACRRAYLLLAFGPLIMPNVFGHSMHTHARVDRWWPLVPAHMRCDPTNERRTRRDERVQRVCVCVRAYRNECLLRASSTWRSSLAVVARVVYRMLARKIASAST